MLSRRQLKVPHYEALCKYSDYPIDIINIISIFASEELLIVINKESSRFGVFDSQFEYIKHKHRFGTGDNNIQKITVTYYEPMEYTPHAAGHTIIRRVKYNDIYTNGWLGNISHAVYNKPHIQPKYEGHCVVQTIPKSYNINTIYYISEHESDEFRPP